MCGRTACMLSRDDIRRACSYRSNGSSNNNINQGNSSWKQPNWNSKSGNGKNGYNPSFNIAPGSFTPVLVSSSHFSNDECMNNEDRILQPMMWGLVPSWHKGKATDFSFKTNNCRSETFLSKPIFKKPISEGKRCVVICEGYYEWQNKDGKKQPYFVHMIQKDGINIHDQVWHSQNCEEHWDDISGWKGPKLMFLAGVFDIWNSDGNEIYSYSILTMESSESLSTLHHRMPVILESNEDITRWLDYNEYEINKVKDVIKAPKVVNWYPVSSVVNNSRNDIKECIMPVELKKLKESSGSKFMMSWLKRETSDVKKEVSKDSKKIKLEKE